MSFIDRKFIVFAVEHYNTLGLIRSLGEKGIRPIYIAIDGKAKVASKSKYIDKVYYVKDTVEGYNVLLSRYGENHVKNDLPFLYCIDDKTISYLDNHFNDLKDKFAFFNAGKNGRINYYMDKKNILDIANKHGLKTLKSYRMYKGGVPDDIRYPIITKSISPVIGGWKSDVHICESKEKLLEAYKAIKSDEILVQEYIEKQNEYCIEGFSIKNGTEVYFPIVSTYNYLLPSYYSPYMTIQNVDNEYIKHSLTKIFSEIGFEGIFEVEFLIGKDGTLYFGEINFRNSTWSYASTVAGVNMPYLWAKGMDNQDISQEAIIDIKEPFIGMVEPIDYCKRVETEKISIAEWLGDFKDAKCTYYYNKDDKEPFFEMMRKFSQLK